MHAQASDFPAPDEPVRAHDRRDCANDSARAQAAVLGLLLGNNDHSGLWADEELQRTLSANALDVTDAIAELIADGLAHRFGGFVFASRAARRFDRLEL